MGSSAEEEEEEEYEAWPCVYCGLIDKRNATGENDGMFCCLACGISSHHTCSNQFGCPSCNPEEQTTPLPRPPPDSPVAEASSPPSWQLEFLLKNYPEKFEELYPGRATSSRPKLQEGASAGRQQESPGKPSRLRSRSPVRPQRVEPRPPPPQPLMHVSCIGLCTKDDI